MRARRLACVAAAVALSAVAVGTAGCASPQPSVGVGVDYRAGATHGLLPVARDKTADAAVTVLRDLGFSSPTRTVDGGDVTIAAENEAGRDAKITVRFQGEQACELWVRIDTLGDQTLSDTIFKRIEQRLGIKD